MKNWYLVHTKPRKEKTARENLQRQDYETYLPLLREPRLRRSQWIDVVEPLFPRYLFVRLEIGLDSFGPIRYTTGVHNLVRFGDQPGVVPDHVVDSLKRTADSETGVHHPQRTLFEPGKIVFIERGLFAGLQAIFQAETAQKRVIVLLEMLGRENRVVVDRNALRSTY